jgi:hypothetical protein
MTWLVKIEICSINVLGCFLIRLYSKARKQFKCLMERNGLDTSQNCQALVLEKLIVTSTNIYASIPGSRVISILRIVPIKGI